MDKSFLVLFFKKEPLSCAFEGLRFALPILRVLQHLAGGAFV
jgi:hypothetical protein